MKSKLLIICLFISPFIALAQPCPGDLEILEEENIQIWKVAAQGAFVYTLGTYQGSVNVSGTNLTQPLGYGVYVAKYDTTGAFHWVQEIVGNEFFATSPTLMVNGTDVVVATTELAANGDHIMRIEAFDDVSANPSWSKSYTLAPTGSSLAFGAQIMPFDGETDSGGQFYIAGAFAGSVDFGVTTLNSVGSNAESFVLALSATGVERWAIQSTGSNNKGRAWAMEINSVDELIIGGHFTGTVDFGGTSFTAGNATIINPYIAKLNATDGAAQFVVGMENGTTNGFNNIYDITVDGLDNIYYTGNFNDDIDVQGNPITAIGGTEILVGAMDNAGNYLWAAQLGGISNADEFGTTINYSSNLDALFVGGQLQTDSLFYNNVNQNLPPVHGSFMFAIATNGSVDPIGANNLTFPEPFGYSATYIETGNFFVIASIKEGDGLNFSITRWVPNRPKPFVHVTLEDGTLDPNETLTAFDPGLSYTYQWYKDNVILGGEITPTYMATTNGEYFVEVTNANGCSIKSKPHFILDGSTLESDSLVLVELYNNTNGPGWNDNTNWLSGNVDSWNGITVNLGRVTEIFLAGNNLDGDFPQSIGNLSQLEKLFIDNNNLTGSIPTSFWNLTNMIEIVIHDNNNLSWTIEPGIQNMISLINISAWNSGLTGSLPVEIGNATSLQHLDISNGSLTGSIPTTIGNLANLINFIVADHQLSGSIPTEIGNLNNLQNFNVEKNEITGNLPIEFGSMNSLLEINCRDNQLNGNVPTEIGNSTTLVTLTLEQNDLDGTLPDEIWQIPTLENINVGFNANLQVVLPANLASLTQLTDLRIGGTYPIGGPFPTDLYSLTNLIGLDIGGHRFTGMLDANVGNWVNLDNFYLWNNFLEGDFPAEITAATNLRALSIAGNNFGSLPDLSSLTSLEDLEVYFNFLDFGDIIPNIGVPSNFFTYSPQKRRPSFYLTVDEGGSIDLVNDYTEAGNVFQWVRNQTDSIATTVDYNIPSATFADLGGYFCYVTNPAVPDLTIHSQFYNVSFSGAPKSFTVDNSPESLADFKSFYAAAYGTNDGDTLLVAGSTVPYEVGFALFERPRIIYGPGYFLAENPETQASTETAKINGGMGFKLGSEGSEVYGLDIDELFLNNQNSFVNDTLRAVHITGNKIKELSINDDVQNILINKNFITMFSFASTTAIGSSRSYMDVTIENNIIDTVTTFFAKATAARNDMSNVVFSRNTIDLFTDSIQDVTVSNNIINDYQATANTDSNNSDFATAAFTNSSTTLSIDNDFIPTNTGLDAGAFSGSDPYILSGLPDIPHIFELTNIGRIRINAQAKVVSGATIDKLNYRLGSGGTVIEKGTVKRLQPGNPVEVLFRPRLGNVTPGGTYNLMLWAKDSDNLRSVHQNLSFVAETTNASGNIFTADNTPVTDGEVLLFEINQEAAAFDTLSTTTNNQGAFTFSNIVIGDYLALGYADTVSHPGNLPTYWMSSVLWEEADTLLIDTTNPTFDITLEAVPKDPEGRGRIAGFLEEEEGEENAGGRVLMDRKRIKRAGVSVRRKVNVGRTSEDEFELVDYTFTDDNGEFVFTKLPPDEYRINIQYPGYPMDTTSNIDIIVKENIDNDFKLEALVKDGLISVSILATTGIFNEIIETLSVYPNPTKSEFVYLKLHENHKMTGSLEFSLHSLSGAFITSNQINLSNQLKNEEIKLALDGANKGTYILRITQQEKLLGSVRLIIH